MALASCSNHRFLESELIDHCRTKVAGYKLPKRVMLVDEVRERQMAKPITSGQRVVHSSSCSHRNFVCC